jgi:hypothetical protein
MFFFFFLILLWYSSLKKKLTINVLLQFFVLYFPSSFYLFILTTMSYSSTTDLSFSHKNGMEGEVMGSRSIGCVCNLSIKKGDSD